jgi:hypothetical protein
MLLKQVNILVLCIVLALKHACLAQFTESKSIEIPQTSASSLAEYVVLPLKNNSFLLQERNEAQLGRRSDSWVNRKYDSQMQLDWYTEVNIDYDYEYITDYLTESTYFQLFTKSDETQIRILQTDLQTGDNQWFEGKILGIQQIQKMKVLGSMVYFSGQYQGKAVVVGISLFDKTIKTLKGFYSNHTELVEIEADTSTNNLLIYSKNRYKGQCQLLLHTYTYNGNHIATTNLEGDKPKKMIPFNGQMYNLEASNALIIGNYSRFCDNFSQGIYVKKLNAYQVERSKFIDFSEFKNFFNYLNARRQGRMQKKISKKKQEGKSLGFNYKMLVHSIQEINHELVVLAEIYYTESKTNTTTVYNGYKNFSYINYKYTHTILCGFDRDGNLLWDNCLPMKQLTNSYLNEQVQLSQLGKNLILAYPENGKIKTQIIEKDKNIKEREEFTILSNKDTRWTDEEENGFAAWYGQNFLVWGFKEAQNGASNSKKSFLVTKLTYNIKPDESVP